MRPHFRSLLKNIDATPFPLRLLRAKNGLDRRDLPALKKETNSVVARFSTAEILRRIRRLEDLRDHLDRNIQEALAIEVAFLKIFGS